MMCKNCSHAITKMIYASKYHRKGEYKHWYQFYGTYGNTVNYKICGCKKAEPVV